MADPGLLKGGVKVRAPELVRMLSFMQHKQAARTPNLRVREPLSDAHDGLRIRIGKLLIVALRFA